MLIIQGFLYTIVFRLKQRRGLATKAATSSDQNLPKRKSSHSLTRYTATFGLHCNGLHTALFCTVGDICFALWWTVLHYTVHSATPGDIWKSAGNPRSVASQNQLEVSDGGDVNDLDDDGGEDKCVDNDEKIGVNCVFV